MPSSHNNLGLTAVILCGEGEKLRPITSTSKLPKCLLPIANRPMLQFPLEWLLDGCIYSIIIVCIQGQESHIQSFVREFYKKRDAEKRVGSNAKTYFSPPLPHVVALPAPTIGTTIGTATLLRQPQVYQLIKNDFMVVSCDSICEVDAFSIVREWLSTADTVGMKPSGMGVYYDIKKDKGVERDMIITSPAPHFGLETTVKKYDISNLMISYGSSTDHHKADLDVRSSLFKVQPRVDLFTSYRDAHIYIFPHWALQFILENPHGKMVSLKDDVIAWWAKATWQGSGRLAHNLGLSQILEEGEGGPKSDAGSVVSGPQGGLTPADVPNYVGLSTMRQSAWTAEINAEMAKQRKELNTRGWFPTNTVDAPPSPVESSGSSDREGKFKKIKHPKYNGLYVPAFTIFKPHMEITPLATTPLVRRVDTLQLYLSTCLELARNPAYNPHVTASAAGAVTEKVKGHAGPGLPTILGKGNVSWIDSLVADGTELDERALIKRSVVGKSVKIEKSGKVQGSVILEGVTVGTNSKLEGCIVGRFVKIGANCQLTNCQVAEGVSLKDGTIEKDALITESYAESSSDDDFFASRGDGGNQDDDDDDDFDDDDDDEEDSSDEDDDNTTSKSVPTTTKESVAPISATVPSTSLAQTVEVQGKADTPATDPEGAKPNTEPVQEETEAAEERADEEEVPTEPEKKVSFLGLDLENEEDEEEEDDWEPNSDDSSFCDEEYDSQFESDEAVSGDDAAELSGPEEDGGPLKSPKRISRGFSEEMAKGIAQMASLGLSGAAEGADKDKVGEEEKRGLPEPTETGEVQKEVELLSTEPKPL